MAQLPAHTDQAHDGSPEGTFFDRYGWEGVQTDTALIHGSYKVKFEKLKSEVEKQTKHIASLTNQLILAHGLLHKCHLTTVETVETLRLVLETSGLAGILPAMNIRPDLLRGKTPSVHAEGIIQILAIFCRAFEILRKREKLIQADSDEVIAQISSSAQTAPATIPSPLLRSYDLLTKTLDDMKANNLQSPTLLKFPAGQPTSPSSPARGARPLGQSQWPDFPRASKGAKEGASPPT
jgi:hypothetical protein